MTGDSPAARVALVSPVLTLLGGAAAEGMVCDVNGVCAPAGSVGLDSSPTGGPATDSFSADGPATDSSSTDGEK